MGPRGLCAVVAIATIGLTDQAPRLHSRLESRPRPADTFTLHLRGGAFPGAEWPDVAVHVPPGFDPARRPGVVLYFHGWSGCVEAALSGSDVACAKGGPLRPAADLAAQVDASRVNAILIAVELRADATTGEPGRMAMPGGARALLRELFIEKLAGPLGVTLEPDALDRIVVIAHSGGYQAVAGVLEAGDLPRVTEVDVLDALYGGQDTFARWVADDAARFDRLASSRLRFVDLYTCCGGTLETSRAMAARIRDILGPLDLAGGVHDDDDATDPTAEDLKAPVLFKRVPVAHAALPRTYVRALLEAAGFARIEP
jgi:hypothetical protein